MGPHDFEKYYKNVIDREFPDMPEVEEVKEQDLTNIGSPEDIPADQKSQESSHSSVTFLNTQDCFVKHSTPGMDSKMVESLMRGKQDPLRPQGTQGSDFGENEEFSSGIEGNHIRRRLCQ